MGHAEVGVKDDVETFEEVEKNVDLEMGELVVTWPDTFPIPLKHQLN